MLIRIGNHLINTNAIAYATIDRGWINTDGDAIGMLTVVFLSMHDTLYFYGAEAVAMHRFLDEEAVSVRPGAPN